MSDRCVLFFDTLWGSALELPDDLPANYRFTTDRWCFMSADAVVFHIPEWRYGLATNLPAKPPGQLWIAWSMECEANYPLLSDADFMRLFDIRMTYRLDSDVPVTYVDAGLADRLRPGKPPASRQGLVAAFISSGCNRSGRQEYFRELARWLPIDSYGEYMRNRSLPEDQGAASKLATLAAYKFTLAFENACARDYVTEKFYDPLIAGSVPITLGAPNIRDFAPSEGCYIDSRDYSGPRALARHVLELDADAAAYGRYHDWRVQPYQDTFQELLALAGQHPFLRLCAAIEARLTARPSMV